MIGILGPRGRLGFTLVQMGGIPLDCDITDQAALERQLWELDEVDTIINCAAYTDVDGAETDVGYSKASKVNGLGPGRLKLICARLNLRLIHISTDYVFSGTSGPYTEKNLPRDPVNSYGFTKFAGDYAIRTFHDKSDIIVRTTGLYGSPKHDFLSLVHKTLGS